MTTTTAVALIALAVSAAFLHPAIIAVVRELRQRRLSRELEAAKKKLEDEIKNGYNLARITALRSRVQKLEHDLDRW